MNKQALEAEQLGKHYLNILFQKKKKLTKQT